MQTYIKFDEDGLVIESWKREPTPNDRRAIIVEEKIVTPPEFYGEWRQVSPEDIDKINQELIAKKKPKILLRTYPDLSKDKRPAQKLSYYETQLIEARKILENKLKGENQDENN